MVLHCLQRLSSSPECTKDTLPLLKFSMITYPPLHTHLTPSQTVMVLHCLQRLSSSPECMDVLLAVPNITPKLWAVYACGDEAVAAEVARLMLR